MLTDFENAKILMKWRKFFQFFPTICRLLFTKTFKRKPKFMRRNVYIKIHGK